MTQTALVPGFGNRSAKIMLVGEAPAKKEVETGKPFQGKAGMELNNLLRDAGINRDDVYCTNASLRPVEGDKDKWFFVKKNVPSEHMLEGMVQFSKDLKEIRPNVVVPLGNYALWMTTQLHGILNQRGSVLWSDIWNRKVVPTIHPAALLRNSGEPGSTEDDGGMWKMRSVVIWDLERAKAQSEFMELRRTKRNLVIDPEGTLKDECLGRLMRADRLIVDIETYGGLKLACIGLSDGDPNWAVTFSEDHTEQRRQMFKMLLERDVPIIGQNLMYDSTMLDQIGINIRNVVWDTMVASHILYPEFPKGLAFLNSIYTDIPYYKDEGKAWKEATDQRKRQIFFEYNAKDVCSTTEIAQKQMTEIAERDLSHVLARKMTIFQPCREATGAGLLCNTEKLLAFAEDTKRRRDTFQAELNIHAGREVNVNSPKQIMELLYKERKLPVRYKNKKPTTDAKALSALAAQTEDRCCGLIILVRQQRKLLSNYYNEGIISPDGRIRYNFNLVGTRFGRLSSDAPLWGPGMNIQNIPHEARVFYEADDPAFELAEFDQVQAEAVITAYLADDPVHIDCFRTGKDVHRVTACLMNGMAPEDWKQIPKKSALRELAKRCNHGLNYGMGWGTFMAIVNQKYDPDDPTSLFLTAQHAKETHRKYLNIRPALNSYWDGIQYELRNNQRTLVSPLGYPYTFLDMWSASLLLAAYSFKPQSTVGEQTNIAIARVYNDPEMRRMDVRFKAQVHDSIVFQWPKVNRAAIMERIFPLLETELTINGYRVVVPWEGVAGPNWYKPAMEPLGQSRETCEVV